jgi:cold shock CspA family protein
MQGEGTHQAEAPSEGRRPARKKGPVISRRGPSEIDRAMRLTQTGRERPSSSPRKAAGGPLSRGTIIRIDRAKGFGFLIDSAGEQRFFHRSAVLDEGFADLKENQAVDFEAHLDERGARALKVRPAGLAPAAPKVAPKRAPASPKGAGTRSWHSDLSPFRNGTGAPASGRKTYRP